MPSDMRKAIKQAALLRNLIETCLQAAANPMTGRELFEWPSIKEQIGTNPSAYSRLSGQLVRLIKEGKISKIGQGMSTTYAWNRERTEAPKREVAAAPELHLCINRAEHSLSFVFEGLRIKIEIAS